MNRERFLGINIEYQDTNKLALAATITVSKIYHLFSGFEVIGNLPKDGPAFIVGNHTSSLDAFRIAFASFETAERSVRGIARKGLLDTTYKELDEVLERTRKKGVFDPAKLPFLSKSIAFMFSGIGAVPVIRGEKRNRAEDRQFLLACDEVINSNQMLGIFIQETRIKEGDLRDVMPGIGILTKRHPDVPIIPVAFLNRKWGNKIIIGESFTENQLEEEQGQKLGAREITALTGDRIARIHHPDVRIKWEIEDRPKLLKSA